MLKKDPQNGLPTSREPSWKPFSGSLESEILLDADIPLASIAENGDHVLTRSKFLGHFLRCEHVGSGRNPYQETFFFRELLGRLIGFVVGHRHDTIKNRSLQHFRDKPRTDALNLMGAWLST